MNTIHKVVICLVIFQVLIDSTNGAKSLGYYEEKAGECPVARGFHSCSYECNSDFDCYGQLKCCFTRCGTLCMRPQKKANLEAYNMPREQKFQKFTAGASASSQKCPSFTIKVNSTNCADIIDQCSSKNDCQSGRLCCSAECGKKRCVKSDTIKTLNARVGHRRHEPLLGGYGYGDYYGYGGYSYGGLGSIYGEGLQRRVPFTYGSRFNPVYGLGAIGGFGGRLGDISNVNSRLPQFNFSP